MRKRTQSYRVHDKPEDYLDSFNEFIKQQLNHSAVPGEQLDTALEESNEAMQPERSA